MPVKWRFGFDVFWIVCWPGGGVGEVLTTLTLLNESGRAALQSNHASRRLVFVFSKTQTKRRRKDSDLIKSKKHWLLYVYFTLIYSFGMRTKNGPSWNGFECRLIDRIECIWKLWFQIANKWIDTIENEIGRAVRFRGCPINLIRWNVFVIWRTSSHNKHCELGAQSHGWPKIHF